MKTTQHIGGLALTTALAGLGIGGAAMTATAQVFDGYVRGRTTEAITLKGEATVGYFFGSELSLDTHQFHAPPVIEVFTPGDTYTRSVEALVTPSSTSAKDYGWARGTFVYTNGGLANPDSLSITLDAHGSAEFAVIGPANKPAAMQLSVAMTYTLLGEPDGGLFRLTLPALPALPVIDPRASHTLGAELYGSGTFIQMHPGDPAQTVELVGTRNYTYTVNYMMTVPHGVDPDFHYVISGGELAASAVVVPEPSEYAACGAAGLLAWCVTRSRRGKR